MLKHLLIPLDGSQLSESALDHALKIAAPKAALTLLMVVDPPDPTRYNVFGGQPGTPQPPIPNPTIDFQVLADDMARQSRNYLERLAERLRLQGYAVSVKVELGSPADLILQVAAATGSDAIVMCTHGRSGLSRWLMGSVTQKVLGNSPCPVYVIPPPRSR
jgi:nucleotide-binding universal stress UspA family protein